MDAASTLESASVQAFVGMVGPGTPPLRPRLEGVTCPPRPPVHGNVLETGSAAVLLFRRAEVAESRTSAPGGVLVLTGRPFLHDRLLEDGLLAAVPAKGELDGKFAGALIRSTGVELFTDALGAGSVYYATRGPDTFFSSHLGLLLGLLPWQPALNDLGLAGQLFARSQIFDETHFSGVFRLPAGQRLVADSSGARLEQEYDGWSSRLLGVDAPTFGPAAFWEMMDAGVQRDSYGPDSVLMYSGGRDSSAVALARSDHPRRSATYGDRYSLDFQRGTLRAKKLGLESHALPYEDWTLDTYSPIIVGLHAGCSGLQTANNLSGFDGARKLATLAAVGFLGDALTGAHSGPRADPDDAYALRILLPNHKDPVLNELFEPERDAIFEHVLSKFHDLSREAGSTRQALMILDLEWRQARWISMMFDLCDWFIPTTYPFFQRRLFASCLQASAEALAGQRDYDRALADRLAERGRRAYDPESRFDEFWIQVRAGVAARLRGKRIVGRWDCPAVMDRTDFRFEDYESGHARLDALTRRSWEEWRSRPESRHTNIPLALTSAPIAAAVCQDMSRKPNLFIIGAQKCGTTSLHHYLAAHPEIFLSEPKEPGYFVPEIDYYPRDREWYLGLFEGASGHRYVGESSTHYTKLPVYPGVVERIADFVDEAPRFIYLMRDPIDRAVSHYWHDIRKFHEHRPIEEAFRERVDYRAFSNYPMQLEPVFRDVRP